MDLITPNARRLSSRVGLPAVLFFVLGVAAQTVPVETDFGIGGTACCLVADGHGGLWVAGTWRQSTTADPGSAVRIVHLNSSSAQTGSWTFGNATPLKTGSDTATGAALDSSGNLTVVGTTSSGSFPVKGPQFTTTSTSPDIPCATDGFILRLDPSGNLLSSSLISGVDCGSSMAVTVGGDGSIYAAGSAYAVGFPNTNLAYSPVLPSPSVLPGSMAFVMKLNSSASAITWSALIGGSVLFSGSLVGELPAYTGVSAIALAPGGQVTITGITNAQDFPITKSLIAPSCCGFLLDTSGYVTRLAANGASLVWSTFTGPVLNEGLTVDASGNAVVTGEALESNFTSTAGAWRPSVPASENDSGFVMKINAAGSAVTAATLLASGTAGTTASPLIDSSGNIIVNGPASSGSSFVATLSSDLTREISSFEAPAGSVDAQVIVVPQLTVLGSAGSILQIPSGMPSTPALLGVMNSGGVRASPQVSPGEFVTLEGTFPEVVDASGVQVTFDGVAAPLLYAGGNQINVVVPFEIAGRTSTSMQIVLPSGPMPAVTLPVESATPGVLLITDATGTPVTLSDLVNLTAPETLTLWADGAGVYQPPLATGQIVSSRSSTPVLPIKLFVNGEPVPIQSAYAAPGAIAGLLQVTFEATPATGWSVFQIQVGNTLSSPLTLQ